MARSARKHVSPIDRIVWALQGCIQTKVAHMQLARKSHSWGSMDASHSEQPCGSGRRV